MKKPYQHPVTQELLITRAVPLLSESNPYLKEKEPENGPGINPGPGIDTGFSREFDYDDEDYDE